MANKLYPLGKKHLAQGDISLTADNIKCLLVTSGYSYNAAYEFHSDIGGGNIVATSGNLASKSVASGGIFNAANLTFSAVTGSTVTQVVMYKDTGTSGTSELIAIWDTGAGLPVTPNGGDITLTWDTGSNKIFVI